MKFLLILLIIILAGGFYIWYGIYLPKTPWSSETEVFLVKKGEGAKEISLNLREQGLIRSSSLFRIYALATAKTVKLQAGEYELSPSMNIPEIVAKLASGDRIKKMITIIEGWTVKDIQDLLRDRPGTVPLELEGYLFPDTYEILPEDGIEEITEKMLANFNKKLFPELRAEIDSQGKTISEIIIMASMLEKEVKTSDDKKIVSGILWKRLENGMPLQVDATITYIKKTTNPEGAPFSAGPYGARISKEETQIDSPYNTYKYLDLPLGPICNPGLESIEAALEPQESDYWYYLSAPDGTTIFSKTLEEHNLAKAKYL